MEWVIDVDAHVTEPADVFAGRLPARFRDAGPRLVRDERSGNDVWTLGDRMLAPIGLTAVAGWPEPFPSGPKTIDEVPRAAWDAQARLEYLDEIGAWAQVMYPNVGGFGNQAFLRLDDPELRLACVRAYNDWLTEWCSADPRRLLAVTATPFWDVDAAVDEIERCAEAGHRGVLFTGEPQRYELPYLGDHHWDPLWAAAQAAGLPVSFHIGSGDVGSGFSPGRIKAHGPGGAYVTASVSLFLTNGAQIVDLLTSGVLPRFPDLKFVSVESGIGFLPFVLEAADYAYGESSMAIDRPDDPIPSEQFRKQVYGCFFFEEAGFGRVVDVIGPDNLMFETDYPHPICLFGNVREKIEAMLEGQPADVRRKVLWDNAAALYRVEASDRDGGTRRRSEPTRGDEASDRDGGTRGRSEPTRGGEAPAAA
ncbi:MAG TPA: amidohydrolase family protein [Acidimicrobiia bacterium]